MSKTYAIRQLSAEFASFLLNIEEGIKIEEVPVRIVKDGKVSVEMGTISLDPMLTEQFLVAMTSNLKEVSKGALIAYRSAIKRYNAIKLSKSDEKAIAKASSDIEELETYLDQLADDVFAPFAIRMSKIDWLKDKSANSKRQEISTDYDRQYAGDRVPTDEKIAEHVQRRAELTNFQRDSAKRDFQQVLGMSDAEADQNVQKKAGSRQFAGVYVSNPYKTGKKAGVGLYRAETSSFYYMPSKAPGRDARWYDFGEIDLKSTTSVQRHTAMLGAATEELDMDEAWETVLKSMETEEYKTFNAGGSASTKKLVVDVQNKKKEAEFGYYDLPDAITEHFEQIVEEAQALATETAKSDEKIDETASSTEESPEDGDVGENEEEVAESDEEEAETE